MALAGLAARWFFLLSAFLQFDEQKRLLLRYGNDVPHSGQMEFVVLVSMFGLCEGARPLNPT